MIGTVFLAAMITIGPIFGPPYEEGGQKQSSTKAADPRRADERLADYTLWLTILTGALVGVSATQIHFLIRADKTARITAEAAKESSDALPRIERAYLFVDRAETQRLKPSVSGLFHGKPRTIVFKNYGRTPAILHEIGARYAYFTKEPPRLTPATPGVLPNVNIAVGSGETVDPVEFALEATPAEIERAERGEGFILFIVALWYYDMLANHAKPVFAGSGAPRIRFSSPAPART